VRPSFRWHGDRGGTTSEEVEAGKILISCLDLSNKIWLTMDAVQKGLFTSATQRWLSA
jgi:hypothetical protein